VEEILVALIQFVLNVIWRAFLFLPFNFCPFRDFPSSRATVSFLAIVFGGLLAWGSLHFFPDAYFRYAWLRIAVLVVSPLFAGWFGYIVAEVRAGLGHSVESRDHFWSAFAFTLGFSVIRFAYAHHVAA
jgi:hypothetical protein